MVSSLAKSLPAHLRNLSAPRIPSPLGKGTPARGVKQSLPVRTSKTTERHVLLPEDPQLAPLPHTTGKTDLAPPPRAYPPAGSSGGRHHGHSSDERSDAEKMTKREREENRLPRLTAYATAEGYRLKLLQAFLKREHGVGVVRVFDDCIYAVYSLPLLPGYGASTKVRSSPNVKSPGGVSLLERMTMAEDVGYDDSYFPSANPEDPQSTTQPLEYILSHSPPSIIAHGELLSARDVPAGHGDEREQVIEEMQERLEAGDGLEAAAELRAGEEVGVKTAVLQQVYAPHGPIGTHMDPQHPGYLEHIPATAFSPQELSPPPEPRHPRMSPKARRKSHAHFSGRIAEAVFFEYGVSVFFGFGEEEERDIMEDCEGAGTWTRGQEQDDWEVEEFHYTVS